MVRKPGDERWGFSNAYFGNLTLGAGVLREPKVRAVVSGHTHAARRAEVRRPGGASVRAEVVGSDYGAPAFVLLDLGADGELAPAGAAGLEPEGPPWPGGQPMAAARRRHWLMKCEPSAYSIDDFARDKTTGWEGVRNYQARNSMRDDMRVGDGVLFYASNAEPSGVVGLAEIARAAFPDPFAFQEGHRYFDPKSKQDAPTWYSVELRFVEKLARPVTLAALRASPILAKMPAAQRASRLSIHSVTRAQFDAVLRLARGR